jgi:large conductance mechanosensitive channel
MLKEFKTFIMRGNVVDLAVAVIIGAAFSAIVNSLIADVITPLLLKPAMETMGVTELEKLAWNGVLYGKFLASVINFLVTAFIIFMMIKAMNRMQKKKEEAPAAPPAPTKDQEILMEIRDLLKK